MSERPNNFLVSVKYGLGKGHKSYFYKTRAPAFREYNRLCKTRKPDECVSIFETSYSTHIHCWHLLARAGEPPRL